MTAFSRRALGRLAIAAGAVALAGPVRASEAVEGDGHIAQRRISGLRARDWRDHFDSVENDAILCIIDDRVLHYWGADGFYRIYPTSVPMNGDLTRRGRTTITLKRPDPEWRPTDNMIARNPDLPRYVGPGPDNPLGVRALNLGFPGAYRIHGTNDIRKVGRQSSNGCIGLFNEHILEVYDRVQVGTPVLLI